MQSMSCCSDFWWLLNSIHTNMTNWYLTLRGPFQSFVSHKLQNGFLNFFLSAYILKMEVSSLATQQIPNSRGWHCWHFCVHLYRPSLISVYYSCTYVYVFVYICLLIYLFKQKWYKNAYNSILYSIALWYSFQKHNLSSTLLFYFYFYISGNMVHHIMHIHTITYINVLPLGDITIAIGFHDQ